MSLLTSIEFDGYLNANREVFTQLNLKYYQRLAQGVKSEEMLQDLFMFSAILRILLKYDTTDLPSTTATLNTFTPKQIKYIIDAANCLRVKYNIPINIDNYILAVEGLLVPLTAILEENGDPILTESGDYILTEE
jgi:hypothetical protein